MMADLNRKKIGYRGRLGRISGAFCSYLPLGEARVPLYIATLWVQLVDDWRGFKAYLREDERSFDCFCKIEI